MEDESGVVHGIVLGGGFQLREVEGRAHTVAMVGEGEGIAVAGHDIAVESGIGAVVVAAHQVERVTALGDESKGAHPKVVGRHTIYRGVGRCSV